MVDAALNTLTQACNSKEDSMIIVLCEPEKY